ncbi:MAG: VacJ family lipoprotein [Thermodesulfobacteriota bacterium]
MNYHTTDDGERKGNDSPRQGSPAILPILCLVLLAGGLLLSQRTTAAAADLGAYFEDEETAQEVVDLPDPFEPVNRVFFHFNDKVYFWALKPASRVYGTVIPQDLRICIRNAFHNLLAPVRVVNNLLQGKIGESTIEVMRFAINTTAGIGGLVDLAGSGFGLRASNEDLGQTLGHYGAGGGWYFCWPLIGPSSLRDTIGMAGDSFLDPVGYLEFWETMAVKSGNRVNTTSLRIGEYEEFKASAVDPYVAMRQAYSQYRQASIDDLRDVGRPVSAIPAADLAEPEPPLSAAGSVAGPQGEPAASAR